MLTNLLPGLRELRAPLSAGYLWITLIWLLVGPHVPKPSDATGFTRRVLELVQDFGAIGGGIALSFAAYLVGAVSQAMLDPLLRRIPTPGGADIGGRAVLSVKGFRYVTLLVQERVAGIRAELKKHGLTLEDVARSELRSEDLASVGLTEDEVHAAEATRALMAARGVDDTDLSHLKAMATTLRPLGLTVDQAIHLMDFRDQLTRAGFTPDEVFDLLSKDDLPTGDSDATKAKREKLSARMKSSGVSSPTVVAAVRKIQELDNSRSVIVGLERAREVRGKIKGTRLAVRTLDQLSHVETRLRHLQDQSVGSWEVGELVRRVTGDLDLVATRLIGNDPDLYSAVDRLRAEAEFRLSIVVPLSGLALLLGHGWNAAWLLLCVPALILLFDAKRRDRSATDLLGDALFLRRVEAPSLEKFERAAADIIRAKTEEAAASGAAHSAGSRPAVRRTPAAASP